MTDWINNDEYSKEEFLVWAGAAVVGWLAAKYTEKGLRKLLKSVLKK